MVRSIFLILIALMGLSQKASAAADIIEQADSAYTDDDFATAAALYTQAISEQGPSAKLYYNLGNAYYRAGKPGNAILSYERALRLDPTDEDIRYNLDFVNSRIIDRPGERGTFLGNLLDTLALSALSNTWAWLGFACFVLTVAALLAYLFGRGVRLRKVGFFGGLLTLLGTFFFLFFAFRSASLASTRESAIVTSASTILSTVPRTPTDRSQEAMLLHEGTKVEILDSVASRQSGDSIPSRWYEVQVDNAHRAWINASDVERI